MFHDRGHFAVQSAGPGKTAEDFAESHGVEYVRLPGDIRRLARSSSISNFCRRQPMDMDLKAFPTARGTYALILRAIRRRRLRIGRLGHLQIEPGWCVYVGSAFGSGGLRARLGHHRRKSTKPHWHIDYLKAALQCHSIWFTIDPEKRESDWTAALRALPGYSVSMPGFGTGDSQSDGSHLFFI